jgi:FkbM family methyltransferase
MNFLEQVCDHFAARYLARRGARHLRAGSPSLAVFAFDHIGHQVNLKGRYEAAALRCAIEFLRESGLIAGAAVDVGANVGNHALYFADHFQQVIALEPNPRVFQLLAFNAQGRPNVRALNVGASDRREQVVLTFARGNWGGGRVATEQGAAADGPFEGGEAREHTERGQRGEPTTGTVRVQLQPLDELAELAELHVGLLKLDVEGHELHALRGAERLIERSRPVVMFEQSSDEIAGGTSPAVDWLRARGYARFYEVRSVPGVPRAWRFRGRMMVNGVLRLVLGERQRVVEIGRFERGEYPLVMAVR